MSDVDDEIMMDDDDSMEEDHNQREWRWNFQRVSGWFVLILVNFLALSYVIETDNVSRHFKVGLSPSLSSSTSMHHSNDNHQEQQPQSTKRVPVSVRVERNETKSNNGTTIQNDQNLQPPLQKDPTSSVSDNKRHDKRHYVTIVTQLSGELGK